MSLERNFSVPKIYSAKGDLIKRWYVYFSFRDPGTGKKKRQTPFYGSTNTYKTKEDRMSVLVTYRKILLKLLKQGYNPYIDNTESHNRINGNNDVIEERAIPKNEIKDVGIVGNGPRMTVEKGFEFLNTMLCLIS